MAKYQKTIFVNSASLAINPPKVGQWVMLDGDIKGQYLGTTKAGTVVMRYQHNKFGKLEDCRSNWALRQFALINGSK